MWRIALISPLKHKPFRFLFSGQIISDLGDWLDYLAVIVLIVYQWKLGAPALAAFSIAVFLPAAFVGPLAGVWVDRWSRRATMITCDLIRAMLVLGLIWAPNLFVLLIIVMAKAITSTFFGPARQALIRATVPDDELLQANSLSQLSVQTTKVLGPAVGGLIVLIAGVRGAFVGDALSFLASATILAQLPRTLAAASVAHDRSERQFWREFRAGFAYILNRKLLATAVGSTASAMFIIFTFDALGALALQALGFGPSLLGLAVGSIGLGTAIGAAVIGQWGGKVAPLRLMGTGDLVVGAAVAVIGSAVLLHIHAASAAWIVLWLILGVAASALFVPYSYLLQRETPVALIGRVTATATGIQTAFQFLAPVIGATLATTLGVGAVFAAAGTALAVLGFVVLAFGGNFRRPRVSQEDIPILPDGVEAEA